MKKLKIPKNRFWKNDIDYHHKLNDEEKQFLNDFANTEYSNAKHPDYDEEDMSRVYDNTNTANRCLMSNPHYPDCPITHYDGDVLGKGLQYEDILLDMENIIEDVPDELYGLWKQDFTLAYDYLIQEYENKPHTGGSLMSFYVKMSKLLRWERIDRNKHGMDKSKE